MPAGDIIDVADFGTPAGDTEATDETGFSNTSYAPGATPCGVAFVAPTSGQVLILWGARFESNTNSVRACISISVRTGGTVGSGTVVSGTDDDNALETPQDATGGANTRTQGSRHRRVTGLTAGDTYNVQLEHKMLSAGNGDIFSRDVDVLPIVVG